MSAGAPRRATVVVNDLSYDVWTSDGPQSPGDNVFVLVHGIGTSHRYMARLHAALASQATVFSIDIPGFGGADKPRVAPGVADVAAGLAAIVQQRAIRGAIIVGHSMGAQWAVELAAAYPHLVRGVVVIGPVADDRRRTLWQQTAALARDVAGEPPNVNAVVLLDYLRCGPSWYLREARHMLAYPTEKRVGDLAQPLLIIRGGDDPIASMRWCRELKARARLGRLVIVPGHRHVVQYTAPRAVTSAIRAFVGTLPA